LLKAVVIDDEYIVIEGLKSIINWHEFGINLVGYAYDGINGFNIIKEHHPDIIFTDIRMSGMDGLSMIKKVKEILPNTIFIIFSGYSEFEYAKTAISLGVMDYIEKPITVDKMKTALKKAVSIISNNLKTNNTELTLIKAEKTIMTKLFDEISLAQIAEAKHTFSSTINYNYDSIIFGVRSGNKEEVMAQVTIFSNIIKEYQLPKDLLYYHCLELVFCGLKTSNETGRNYSNETNSNLLSNLSVMCFNNNEDILTWTNIIFNDLMDWVISTKYRGNHKSIIFIKEYLDKNYNSDITLDKLAELAHMNSTYLSLLFKQEIGTTYVKYLTGIRLDKAKSLLKTGYKVFEVSEMVGYPNYRRFCQIFKSSLGITPNQYKTNSQP